MEKKEYLDFCASLPGARLDQPFSEDFETVVVRHSCNRKWFALVMEREGKTFVNLKCDPMEAVMLRSAYQSVIPAWHMNKTHWNTVFLVGDVPPEELFRMTEESFRLTKRNLKNANSIKRVAGKVAQEEKCRR